MTMSGCLHTSYFIDGDIGTPDYELDEGFVPNCGFYYGGCSHTGGFSLRELRLRFSDIRNRLMFSLLMGPFSQAPRREGLLGQDTNFDCCV